MKNLVLIFLALALFTGQGIAQKYFLPIPVESSNGRPIVNQDIDLYTAGTTSKVYDGLTWLDAGRYYWADTSLVPEGTYDVYVNDNLWQSEVAIIYTAPDYRQYDAADTTALMALSMAEGKTTAMKQISTTNTYGGGDFLAIDSTYKEGISNGGYAFNHLTSGLQWVRPEWLTRPGWVNVIWTGAIPNDDLSDSTAFQIAVNTGYNVAVPAGVYNVADITMATRGQTMEGFGNHMNSGTGAVLKPSSMDCALIIFGAELQMSVKNISFFGQTATDTARYGVRILNGGSGQTIEKCDFQWFTYGTGSVDWNVIPFPDTSYAVHNYSTFDCHIKFNRFYRNDVHYRADGGTQVTQFFGNEMFTAIINHLWISGGSTFAFYGGNLESGSIYAGYDAFVKLQNVFSFSFYDWSAETGNAYAAYDTHTNPGANDSLNIGWLKVSHPGAWYTITAEAGGVVTLGSDMASQSGNDTITVSDWAETSGILTQIGDTLRIGSEKMVLYRYPAAGNTEWYVHRLGTPATHSTGDTVYVYEPSTIASTNLTFRGGGFSGGSYHSTMRAHLPVVFDASQAKRPVNITIENCWIAEFLEGIVRKPTNPYHAKNIHLSVKNSFVKDIVNNYSYIDYASNIDFTDIPDTTSWFKGYGGGHFINTNKYGNPMVLERKDAYNHPPQAQLTIYQDDDGGYFAPYDNKYSLNFSGPHPYSGTAADYDHAAVASNATTQADFNWAADSSRTVIVWFKPQRLGTGGAYPYEVPNEGSVLYTSHFKVFRQWHSGTYLNGGIFDEFDNAVTEVIQYYGGNVATFERGHYPRENEWSMFAYAREANTTNSPDGRVLAYLDGALHWEQSMPYDESWNAVPQLCRYLNGQVDDLAVYRGVLSAAQIDSIYNKGKCPDLQTYPASAVDSLLCWFDFEKSNFGAASGATADTVFSVTDAANEYILVGNGSDAETKANLVKDSPTYTSAIKVFTETDDSREGDDPLFEVDKDGSVATEGELTVGDSLTLGSGTPVWKMIKDDASGDFWIITASDTIVIDSLRTK